MVVGTRGEHIFLTVSVVASAFLLITFPAKILVYLEGLETASSCLFGFDGFCACVTITGIWTVLSAAVAPHWP